MGKEDSSHTGLGVYREPGRPIEIEAEPEYPLVVSQTETKRLVMTDSNLVIFEEAKTERDAMGRESTRWKQTRGLSLTPPELKYHLYGRMSVPDWNDYEKSLKEDDVLRWTVKELLRVKGLE